MKEKKIKSDKESSLKLLTKSSVWDITEQDILKMWEESENDADLQDSSRHYLDLFRVAFDVEKIPVDKDVVIRKYEERGYTVGMLRMHEKDTQKWAIKKRPIQRVTDLTYENIRHITAKKLLEVIDRNFGGGWDSLSQSIQDIILAGFDISTTTLPQDRLHNPGGMYETKVKDGFDVLEIQKGTWVEAIFAKVKPKAEKFVMAEDEETLKMKKRMNLTLADAEDDDDEDVEIIDNYNMIDEDDDYDEDRLTEESYRTTFETDPDDLTLDGLAAAEDSDDY